MSHTDSPIFLLELEADGDRGEHRLKERSLCQRGVLSAIASSKLAEAGA